MYPFQVIYPHFTLWLREPLGRDEGDDEVELVSIWPSSAFYNTRTRLELEQIIMYFNSLHLCDMDKLFTRFCVCWLERNTRIGTSSSQNVFLCSEGVRERRVDSHQSLPSE